MSTLDGRAALSRFDQVLVSARRAVAEAIEAEKEADGEMARIRQAQAAAYLALADFKLDTAGGTDRIAALERLDGEVADLLARQDEYIATIMGELRSKAEEIERLEAARETAASELDEAVERYEAIVAEVEASLETSETYRGLVEAAAEAEAVTERARQKLLIAEEDRAEKGAPYEADPLFMYLWSRGFRTPDYSAPPPIRFLDGWVAGVCRYDRAWRNYERLTALPGRIREHVGRMEGLEKKARDALEGAELHALETAGADAQQQAAEAARARLAELDQRIEAAEADHLALARNLAEAEAGERGPAHEARLRLADVLRQSSFPDLRLLVTQTVTAEDDRIVDRLVTLRKEEIALDMRRSELTQAPKARQRTLEGLERFRRLFKVEQFDSPYVQFSTAAIDSVLEGVLAGRLRPEDAVRTLGRKIRRRQPRAHPGFGGRSRRRTSGIPEIAQDIGWEILKEMGRSSRRGGSPFGLPGGGFPTSRRSGRGISLPKGLPKIGGGRSGGFRTGGGF